MFTKPNMVTLFLEKEENNINVMVVGWFFNIGAIGKFHNFLINFEGFSKSYKGICTDFCR